EQLAMLECAGETETRDLVRRPPSDVASAKRDPSLAAINAADAIEHAGFARTIRPDQREQLAGVDRERHLVENHQAAEAQRQIFHFELSHTTSGYADIA